MNAPSDGAIRLFCANVTGIESNCNYPNERQITGEEALEAAVARDYVVARFKNSYRNTANFLSANCLCKDCDNDHSDNPADWVTPEDVRRAFPDVTLAIHYIPGAGYKCYGFYGMLSVEYIVVSIAAAHFHRIDLVKVKLSGDP